MQNKVNINEFKDTIDFRCALVLLLALICFNVSFSQTIRSYTDKDFVQLGEKINFTISVDLPADARIAYTPYDVAIPVFRKKVGSEMTEDQLTLEVAQAFEDTVFFKGKSVKWVGKYSLYVWDTGKIVIPAQKLLIDDSTYLSNEVSFNANGSTIGVNDELFDIEEEFLDVSEEHGFISFLKNNWYWIILALIVLGVSIWLFIRQKRLKDRSLLRDMSLKDRTLYAINSLEGRKLWLVEDYKLHYTELSHIMRSYLSSRYEVNLLEATTSDTKNILLQKAIAVDTVETFMVILQQADMVKFAKSSTDESTVINVLALAKQIVAETSPIDINSEVE